MTDDNIDRLVQDVDPYEPEIDLRGADQALLEEIMTVTTERENDLEQRRRWRRPLAGALVAAVLAVAIAIPALNRGSDTPLTGGVTVQAGNGTDQIKYTAAAVEVAKNNPRLLIDEPGWKATTVYGFAKDRGTINFTNGDRQVEMNWYPAKHYQSYFDDRTEVSKRKPITIDGQTGSRVNYSDTDIAGMLEPEGPTFVEIRTASGFDDTASVLGLFAKIKHVSVATWLAALPSEIVVPAKIAEATNEVLADVPTPPGFDRSALAELGVNDRYQFGAETVTRVVCGWLGEWQRADRAGDRTAAATARNALGGTRNWSILVEMDADGDYSDDMWGFSDQVRAGQSLKQLSEFRGCSADE